ncbi:MAG TPA: c-type cytochrome [Candidatus Sphingobacterium stercorigallinarum]|nr:c-type cytochrome [Candidatus Sphingobacterium stercorigallinarum]
MNLLDIIGGLFPNTIAFYIAGNVFADILYISILIVMIAILAAALSINQAMRSVLRLTNPKVLKEEQNAATARRIVRKKYWSDAWNYFMGLKPIEQEKSLIIDDHQYDGIVELDNPIPVWFNALFYSTVVFAVAYLLIYHVLGWGLNQDQEYENEMARAELAKKEYLSKTANLFDEHTIEPDESGSLARNGEPLFATNCAACHGMVGEGGIGPNLTDRFWIHGGEIKDVFRTIKYGVPEKGMVPWEQTLTPGQIAELSNYILSLRDTRPPNAKGAEGVEVAAYENERNPAPANGEERAAAVGEGNG